MQVLVLVPIASLTIFILFYWILKLIKLRQFRHKTFKRIQIPGPEPNLLHGQLFDTRREAFVRYAHKLHEKYGKSVGIFLGGDPFIVSKDLDLIQEVFVAKSRFFYDRMHFYLNIDPVPDNLICQRGDRWRYMRRLLSPSFTHSKIRSSSFYRDTWQTTRKFMQQLEANKSTDGQSTLLEDLYDRMAAIALDVIVKTAFHMDDATNFSGPLRSQQHGKREQFKSESESQSKDHFLDTVKRACRLGMNPLVELIFCLPFLDKPLTCLCNKLYFNSIIKMLLNRLESLLKKPTNSNELEHDKQSRTISVDPEQRRKRIIDNLIQVLKERKISKTEFTGNAFVIVFAGFETTANALTFTLWLLAKHERVQVKLRSLLKREQQLNKQQMQSLKLDKCVDWIKLDEELSELATGPASAYLEMVINESLRLYPPVPGLSCRQASQDCTLRSGQSIEKGVNILASVFSIQRDAQVWGHDSHEFRPERFECLDDSQLNSAMFMPFGLGPRNCIGKALAMHEMKIVVALLVLGYSIEPWLDHTPDKLSLCSPINITLTCAHKIALKFVKLSNK